MTNDDMELVRQYAAHQSESAFATLVSRHANLVYSVALRQVRDPQLAEEITQAVFIILARKAGALSEKTILPGWLYRTACYTASSARKQEYRRQRREQEAYMQSHLQEVQTDAAWKQMSPLLEEAMLRLRQTDRDALVLRFFEGQSLNEVGLALGASEDAAKKRVNRALERLRAFFTKRGVNSTSAIIAGALTVNSVHAAPAALAEAVTAVAMAKGVAASGSTLTLIKGALKIMAWTKAKMAIVTVVGILLAAGTTTVTVKEIQEHKTYVWEVPKADFDVFYKTPPMVTIVPTKFAEDGGWCMDEGRGAMGIAQPLVEIIQAAYQKDKLRTVINTDLPTNKYDFFAKLVGAQEAHKNIPNNENWTIALQKEIANKFGIRGDLEMRETYVLVLKPSNTGARGFKISHTMTHGLAIKPTPGNYSFYEQPLTTLTSLLERNLQIPIIDHTGLMEDYDYTLKWNVADQKQTNLEVYKQALFDQLGLELVPSREPIQMLVVTKVK
jgi:uncharacterized protein (TIGR03435 family)